MRAYQTCIVLALAVFLFLPEVVVASSPPGQNRSVAAGRAPAIFDNTARLDANNLDMVVTNHGSFAYDLITGGAGLTYPKGSTRTAVFAAGPWIGALVNGQARVAVGEYAQEFTPGPMLDGTFQPDQPDFKTYTIVRGNTTSSDYLNWPSFQGAPLGPDGKPLLLGDVTMWSIYNDADPYLHAAGAGGTMPLGIEIQQTSFAFNRSGPLGNTIYLRFKLINKGSDTLEDAYFSLWSDPDLGGFTDDLVGCDTTLSMGYCYNATNSDAVYGAEPPAVGFCLLRGPVVAVSPGVYDTLGMVSFSKYINGTDPIGGAETYNYMRGLQRDGTATHVNDDPYLPITTYQVSGDPVTGTGWLDSNPADRRLALSSGPFRMNPGDVQEIEVAITIGQGDDRLSSVAALRSAVPIVRGHADGDVPVLLPATVDLDPDVINLASRAPTVTACIEVPGFSPASIDLTSLQLAGSVPAVPKFAVVGDRDGDGLPDLTVKFSREALNPLLTPGVNDLEVTGALVTGEQFKGSDQIRVINPPQALFASVAPNPLNPSAILTFRTKLAGAVVVRVFDFQGRLVRTLLEAPFMEAGVHETVIDGRASRGGMLPTGVYLYRIDAGGEVVTGRFAILK